MSLKAAIGKSLKKSAGDAAREAVSSCLLKIPAQEVSLAIVFSTPALATPAMLKNLNQMLKANTPIIGCSSMNIISDEGAHKEGLILILISSPLIKVSCGLLNTALCADKNGYSKGHELGYNLLSNIKGYSRQLCLLLNDGLAENTMAIINGLQGALGKSFPFIGGGASDSLEFKQTWQYYNQDILNKGLSAALFAGKLNYGFGVSHGWKPLGKNRVITESRGNIIKKIDGRKASHLYEDYFAKPLADLKKELRRINILYPIGIYLEGEREYLLRNVIQINDDGSIITQGDTPEGSLIRLMIGTKDSCLDAARKAAGQAKEMMHNKDIRLGLIISSVSRAYLLRKYVETEISIIKEILGPQTPLAGFYSYGEYAPFGAMNYQGQTCLHNQAITVLGLGD